MEQQFYVNDLYSFNKYPITKDKLKDGGKIKVELEEKAKNSIIEDFVEKMIDCISRDVVKQAINESEYTILEQFIDKEKYKIVFSSEPCTMIGLPHKQDGYSFPNYYYGSITQEELNKAKLKIVEKLKERFPDSIVTIDDLYSCIMVDWS